MSAPFMQLYVADYLGDTRHLTTEQHGAYLLLLMTMWRSDGVLSDDPAKLARIAGLTVARWKRIADDIMAFFTPCEGGITQGRLSAELTIADEKSEKRSKAGKAGARAKSLKDKKASLANASRLPNHSPEPEPEREDKASSLSLPAIIAVTKPKAKASKRCPDDWTPSAADLAVGEGEGMTPGEIVRALAKMRDHSFRTARTDWSATFRNWLRTDAESRTRNAKPDKLAARHDNYDASWTGSERAAELMAARRTF